MTDQAEPAAEPDFRSTALARLAAAERNGLKIAIGLRTLATGIGLIWWLSVTLTLGFELRLSALAILGFYTAIGLAHYFIIGTRFDRPWIKYAVVALDALGICAAFVFVPISAVAEVPQVLSMRIWGVHLLIPIIVLAGLTLSWQLVVWAGSLCSLGWFAVYWIVTTPIRNPLSWDDLPRAPDVSDYETIFLSVDFVGRGNRVIEIGILLIVAAILAVTVYRARQVFLAQLKAETQHASEKRRRQRAAETLGRFVPRPIAEKLLDDDGPIKPEERETSVLILDIAGFSSFAATHQPRAVIESLDAYLSRSADIVADAGGVVISYTGDGLLATFNNPIARRNPQSAALKAALAVLEAQQDDGLKARIGLAHGPVVAGRIGSRSREAFTVYGETVNIAARLQQQAKIAGCSLLLDEAILGRRKRREDFEPLGELELRGIGRPVRAYAMREA